MIRIMTAEEPASTTITVDGLLSGEGVAPVESFCMQALSQGKPVRLYLRDVTAIDERGRIMLQHLVAEGVALKANGSCLGISIPQLLPHSAATYT